MNTRATVVRPNGHTTETHEMGKVIECDTLQCVHCGMHWQHKPGSGKVRGYCTRCCGPICGPKCQECYPQEEQYADMCKGIWVPPGAR